MKFATKQIHAGQHPEETTGAVITPIFQTSTYSNKKLGDLENGKYGFCFSSGMAAVQTVINLFKPGDHVICTNNVYGGTYRLYEQVMKNYGLEFSYVDTSDNDALMNAIKPNTKFIYVETPTNPMLNITDLKNLGKIGREKKITTCVDNTFMSPYFQNPLDFGIDIVLHSTTKYINGHSDVIGGCLVTSNDEIAERFKFLQNSIGSVPAPFDCWLILRSTKTLAQRMKAHNENAITICKVLSLDVGSYEKAVDFCNALEIFQIAESLGGVESLVCHPVSMTHGTVPKYLREDFGLTDGLVRLSVGIEDIEDLLADINNALSKL